MAPPEEDYDQETMDIAADFAMWCEKAMNSDIIPQPPKIPEPEPGDRENYEILQRLRTLRPHDYPDVSDASMDEYFSKKHGALPPPDYPVEEMDPEQKRAKEERDELWDLLAREHIRVAMAKHSKEALFRDYNEVCRIAQRPKAPG